MEFLLSHAMEIANSVIAAVLVIKWQNRNDKK